MKAITIAKIKQHIEELEFELQIYKGILESYKNYKKEVALCEIDEQDKEKS